ncbi:TonB-dependent receptor [Sphingomonas yantingensis]|uniref:Iron complex outermembrane receptor protein n=1 Tax=Sphingomonas yantingensis TaxID=1241761 RepID=A0A7W9AMR6_9SPHN|nr:TonB-dependent receptor [Sphingomonas yantingensis]MBB5697146.1 iron complex outermembrane receptor protein [Sphingomonas yantingensis]
MLLRPLLLASTMLVAAPAFAEDKAAPAAADTPAPAEAQRGDHSQDRTDIIVTAPYEQTQGDILSGTSVLTGQALTRDLRPSIGDTLARLPGVSASSFGPSASRPILRGFSGDRVRVLIDGIGSVDASTTSVDHAPVINPLTADRIEVLRGPSALLFGSSAIGGVVNVIDNRIPRRLPEEAVHLDVIGNYGTAAKERSVAGEIDVPIAGKLVAHLDGSYLKTDDLRTGGYLLSPELRALAASSADPDVRENATLRGRIPNTASETWEVAGGLSVVTDRGHLGFSVSHYDSIYGVPARIGYDETTEGEAEQVRLALKQTRFDIRGEVETEGFLDKIRVRLAAADYRHDEIEDTGEVGTSFFNQGYEGRLELVQRAKGGWKGASGVQMFIRDFDVQGEEKFVPRNTTEQYGVFTLQSLDMGRFRVEGGARYEQTSLTAQADAQIGTPRYERRFDAISGSLGASYQLTDGIRIGLNGSHSERAPAAEELFANGPHAGTQSYEIGDPTFAKEKSWGLEATLRGSAPGVSFALAGYYNWFTDYIYQSPTGEIIDDLPVFQYAQADARVWGFEAEAKADLATFGTTKLSVDGLADYVRTTITGVGPAPRIPPLRMLGGIEANGDKVNGRFEVEHVFEQDRVTDFELPTNGYTMVNASLAFKPFGRGNATSLTLSANNLFDVEARRHASFLKDFAPLAGRDIRATLRFQI